MPYIARSVSRTVANSRIRRTLRVGTAASAVAAALLLVPGGAMARDRCGAPVPGAIKCALTAPRLVAPTGAAAPDTALPVDLTVRASAGMAAPSHPILAAAPRAHGATFGALADTAVVDPTVALIPGAPSDDVAINEGTVATDTDYASGIATRTNGTTGITVDSVRTDGRRSAGVHAYGYGDITIDAGSVETHGYRSDGIYANNNVGGHGGGGIAITAGSVETTGYASTGIRASAYQGSTSITADSVKTGGYGSDAIYGWSYYGDTTVDVGTVETSGAGGRGITAYSGGTTTVIAGDVTTSGDGVFSDFDAGAIKAVGAAVNVQAGTVSTQGDYSAGIYANSNFVHDNGQEDRDITVKADKVSTAGNYSAGVVAVNIYGDNHIDVAQVTTTGDYSPGVYAYNVLGSSEIHAGEVSTGGVGSAGVFGKSAYGGDIGIDVGTVATSGDNSVGVEGRTGSFYAPDRHGSVDITIENGVTTSGIGSYGVVGYGLFGDVSITNNGTVATSGEGGLGIVGIAYGGSIDIDGGTVHTSGGYASGIYAYGLDSDITIRADEVITTGDQSAGISVVALPGSEAHNVSIDVGTVSTDGVGPQGAAVAVFNGSTNGTTTVNAAGLSTQEDWQSGVFVSASAGTAMVNVGDAVTHGDYASAISVIAGQGSVVTTGSISTEGAFSDGIRGLSSGNGLVLVNNGDIATSGDHSAGIHGGGYGGMTAINSGTITTGGAYSHGISVVGYGEAWGGGAPGSVTVENSGAIHTSGYAANGIQATSYDGPITVNNGGTIQVDGTYGVGILAQQRGGDGAILINAGNITTNGEYGAGVVALGGTGGVQVNAGNIYSNGYGALGIIASAAGDVTVNAGNVFANGPGIDVSSGGDMTVTAGQVSTFGMYADGISLSGAGTATVDAGEVRTNGVFASGILVNSGGAATVSVGNVSTGGDVSNAIEVRSGGADVHVSGDVTTYGYGSRGVLVRSYGGDTDITIDGSVRTQGFASTGIYAGGAGDVTIAANAVSTGGDRGSGIVGFSSGGSVSISATDVATEGDFATGIYAGIRDIYDTGFTGNIDITADSVETRGSDMGSSGIIAINYSTGGDVTIDAGSVSTRRDGASGIYALADDGAAAITVGDVSTRGADAAGVTAIGKTVDVRADSVATIGDYSSGVIAIGAGDVNVHVGTVTTEGYGAPGIYVRAGDFSNAANATVDFDSIATTGDRSRGVDVQASGDVTVTGGSVSTGGWLSSGVETFSMNGRSDVTLDSVTVQDGNGIFSQGYSGATATVGTAELFGDSIYGVVANTYKGDAAVTATGAVATHGEGSYALIASSFVGKAIVNAADVTTDGNYSNAILANGASAEITVSGNVSVAGASRFPGENGAITAIARTGDASVKVDGSIETSGYAMAGVFAVANNDVSLELGDIKTHGDYAPGAVAIGYGNASITAGTVETDGIGSTGVFARAGSRYYSGDASVTVDSVTTHGYAASGVSATSFYGGASVDVGTVSTDGDYAMGVVASSYLGDTTIHAGTVTTRGDNANGIYAGAGGGALTVDVDNVTTSGDYAAGVRTQTISGAQDITVGNISTAGELSWGIFATTGGADTTITGTGTIATSGPRAEAVRVNSGNGHTSITVAAIETGGEQSSGIHVFAVGDNGKSASVTAGSIVTTGAFSHGIWLENLDDGVIGYSTGAVTADAVEAAYEPGDGTHDFAIKADSIKVGGEGSIGIYALGTGRITAEVGTVTSAGAEAIKTIAREENSLTIGGTVSSGSADAVQVSGSDVSVMVGAGGKVSGVNGIVASATGAWTAPGSDPDGPVFFALAAEPGVARIENAGTVVGGRFAVSVDSGRAEIINSGTMQGAVRTLFEDDSFTNSGVWSFATDSDFGDGNDLLVNTGTIRLLAGEKGPAGNVTLAGLERLENSGTISLQNGVAGDTLTIPGNYVGSGAAKLALDVAGNSGAADGVVITGAATGSTAIVLANLDAGSAALIGKPLTLVRMGAGSSADAFTLATDSVGFIRYGLSYDSASGSYQLASAAGAPVYGLAKLSEGAQAIWLKSADAWSSHLAEGRDAPATGRRLWGQMFGGVNNRDERRTVSGGGGVGAATFDLDYRQDFYGGELGYDAVQQPGFSAGVMAGYISSRQRFRATGDRATSNAFNIGGYAGIHSGPAFANLLVKYDHYAIKAVSRGLGWSDDFDGDSVGAELEAGARLGGDALFVEPVASLAWQSTSIGDLEALNQTIDFDRTSGLRGKAGARLGGAVDMGGTRVVFYGGASYAHEFEGKGRATLLSGGTGERVQGERLGDYGQAVLGLTIAPEAPVSGFLQGSGTFGSSYSGADGRVGIRFRF